MRAVRLKLSGRVQGVFFRAWTRQQAEALGVRGWVRNLGDGSLEAHLEGDEFCVSELIELMRSGPTEARVDCVDVSEGEAAGFAAFSVEH